MSLIRETFSLMYPDQASPLDGAAQSGAKHRMMELVGHLPCLSPLMIKRE
jgi:hypothetical protein